MKRILAILSAAAVLALGGCAQPSAPPAAAGTTAPAPALPAATASAAVLPATASPAASPEATDAPGDAEDLFILITSVSQKDGGYALEAGVQNYVSLTEEELSVLAASTQNTTQVDGQEMYFVDSAAFSKAHPEAWTDPAMVGVLYDGRDDFAAAGIMPVYYVVKEGDVYGVHGYDFEYTPHEQASTLSGRAGTSGTPLPAISTAAFPAGASSAT
jgi:hypothetical protein